MYKILTINLLSTSWETGINNLIVKDLEGLNEISTIGVKLSADEFQTLVDEGFLEFENIAFICSEVTINELKLIDDYNRAVDDYHADKHSQETEDINHNNTFTNLKV